jgi:plastocyanin
MSKDLISIAIMAVLMASVLVLSLPSLAEPAQSTSNATTVTILIQDSVFDPISLAIEKGTTVTWVNADRDVHKVKGNTFESNELNRGDAFSYTFNASGTYDYEDAMNPTAKGEIIVK